MLRVAILLIAIAACAHAGCIGAAFSQAYAASTGITPVNVDASVEVALTSIPICSAAYGKGSDGLYHTCCSADAFQSIKSLGGEYAAALQAVDAQTDQFDASKNDLDKAADQVCKNAQTQEMCDGFKELVSLLKDFLKNFGKNYKQCAVAYRDYLEGALCAICSPTFTPDIAIVDGTKITFTWAPETCTDFAGACAPVMQNIFDFTQKLLSSSFFSSLTGGAAGGDSEFDFLEGVEGATTADKIKNLLCYTQLSGVATIDFAGVGNIASGLGGDFGQIGGKKRDEVSSLIKNSATRLRKQVRTFTVRQTPSSSNAYNGTYNPVAVGQKSSFVGGSSSAITVTISMAAFIIAMMSLFMF